VNIVQILCKHEYKEKKVKTFSNLGKGIKKNGGGDEFNYDIFDIL
jgi:hypothetical protein